MTNRPRLYKSLSCIAAVLSLCISAFATCQCTHHELTAAADRPPCHSHLNDEMAMGDVGVPADSRRIDPGCSCFVNVRVPAVVSGSENTTPPAAKDLIGNSFAAERVERAELVLIDPSTVFEATDHIYSSQILLSRPSRAPPRLNFG